MGTEGISWFAEEKNDIIQAGWDKRIGIDKGKRL